MRVYIATRLDNREAARRASVLLLQRGHDVTFRWWDEPPATTPEQLAAIAVLEADGVRRSDVLLAILPGLRGTHVEIGMALAWGIPVIIANEDPGTPCAFHYLPEVRRAVDIGSAIDLIAVVEGCLPAGGRPWRA